MEVSFEKVRERDGKGKKKFKLGKEKDFSKMG